ncbi:hypothetical protein BDV95DRAFT_612102 [Massariosphaeria phaeospora]|uniref:DUF7730 domain-containing protein n=1 Tax=Massariosphaeria phaeospora TaxID=100035 RepID=A0A7C8I1V5_9PLEO|nr:hypothetical protein BDV95DRAFT_612102 [Massariosphaeria phaeospora]
MTSATTRSNPSATNLVHRNRRATIPASVEASAADRVTQPSLITTAEPPSHPSPPSPPDGSPPNHSTLTADTMADAKPFPFLKLPAELRCQIYEILLTNNRDPNDRVLLANDLKRRCESRKLLLDCKVSCLSSTARRVKKELPRNYQFMNRTEATKTRLDKPLGPSTPLLSVEILRTCREVYQEARHVMYTMNTFSSWSE